MLNVFTVHGFYYFRELLPAELPGSVTVLSLVRYNGLEIPYLGYLEPDFEVLGCVIPRHGVLVVHDPPKESNSLPKVPGILGNIIKACYQVVIRQSGSKLIDLSAVAESSGPWLIFGSVIGPMSLHPNTLL